ncbi:MAG: drug/metabolite transporter (DMT)-like permease [Sulfurimonas sp.]|jgi:drug/metabolite transporter (DMT)-like permease
MNNLTATFALIFAMLIWASSFVALKAVMQELNEFTVIFFRMLIASACFLYFIKSFLKYEFTKKDLKLIVLLAFFEPSLYFIFEIKALGYTSASQAGLMTSFMPILTAMLAGFFLKEIITKQLLVGAIFTIAGAVWLSLQSDASEFSPNPLLGNFLEFMAMLCGAGYTIVARYLSNKFSALFITALQSFIGAIFFFPFFVYEYITMPFHVSNEAIGWLLYLGVVVTLGGYGLYNYALTKIQASKAAMFINLIPIFTLILAYFILNEVLSTMELIASAIIIFGVFISQIKKKSFIIKYKKQKC